MQTKLTLDAKRFKHFLKLMNFSNRFGHQHARFFSLTGPYFWRSDHCRLAAWSFPEKINAHWHYAYEDVSDWHFTSAALDLKTGQFSLSDPDKGDKVFAPCEAPVNTKILDVFKNKSFDFVFEIPSLFLSRNISLLQRKLQAKNISLETVDVVLDLDENTFSVLSKEEIESTELPFQLIQENAPSQPKRLRFLFSLFNDSLANATKFNKNIRFFVINPYAAILSYTPDIASVLLQKREVSPPALNV